MCVSGWRREKRCVRVEGEGVCVWVEKGEEMCEGGGRGCVCLGGEGRRDV